MIQLTVDGRLSFARQPGSTQWLLEETGGSQKALPVNKGPFVIGRSKDCNLILPDTEALRQTTSRWHCYISEKDGQWTVTDGSRAPVADMGQCKPSISGTFLNGRRIAKTEAIKLGDTLAIGPWEMRIRRSDPGAINIDKLLARLGEAAPIAIPEGVASERPGLLSLEELFTRLYGIKNSEECFSTILAFAMEKIRAAQVAAILMFGLDGTPSVRLAWQRGVGPISDFRFSLGLLKSLAPDRAFLLKSNIRDITESQMDHNISSGLLIPLRGKDERLGVLYMDNRNLGGSFQEVDLYMATTLANVAALHLALERQSYLMRVEQNMRQYFGPEVAGLIVDSSRQGKPVSLGVKECEATVFFADMQSFSAFCRGKNPVEVSELLNPYFQIASEAIQANGGHVDKFIGDGVMGIFGAAPIDDPRMVRGNHAEGAVRAGRELIERWKRSSAERWGAPIPVRVGINTGRIVLGNIGSRERMEFSALGDAVNLASRLEGLAGPNGIAISDSTKQMLGKDFPCIDGGSEDVHGFGPTHFWRISPWSEG